MTPPLALTDELTRAVALYRQSVFDILGSGWTSFCYGARPRGTFGVEFDPGPRVQRSEWPDVVAQRVPGHHRRAAALALHLVSERHVAIDWQLDVKCGHRWSERTWWRDITIGDPIGCDVKVPWEFGRLQHLAHVALAHAEQDELRSPLSSDACIETFVDHVADFVACNAPGFGVQWSGVMDVAIRVANIVFAYDVLRTSGWAPPNEVAELISATTLDHLRFIRANLDTDQRLHGNHYLADVAGLLWASAYLSGSEADEAFAFAARELLAETRTQFDPDGVNREGSTAYHALTAEIVLWSTALLTRVAGTDPERFGEAPSALDLEHWVRLMGMGRFIEVATKPDGRLVQIGDNDSGRFFRLPAQWDVVTVEQARGRWRNLSSYVSPDGSPTCLVDRFLDHQHLVDGIATLRRGTAVGPVGPIILTVAKSSVMSAGPDSRPATTIGARAPDDLLESLSRSHVRRRVVIEAEGAFAAPDQQSFPTFGLFVWRATRAYIAVRCGPLGQSGRGGHAHNDQLAIELMIDGESWLEDPGSYCYTPSPTVRDSYRSISAHSSPRLGSREPWGLADLFALSGDGRGGTALYVRPDRFVGSHMGFGHAVYRDIRIFASRLVVDDYLPSGEVQPDAGVTIRARSADETARAFDAAMATSPGYGWLAAVAPLTHTSSNSTTQITPPR